MEQEDYALKVQLATVPAECTRCQRFWHHILFSGIKVPHFNCPHCGVEKAARQVDSLVYAN